METFNKSASRILQEEGSIADSLNELPSEKRYLLFSARLAWLATSSRDTVEYTPRFQLPQTVEAALSRVSSP